VIPHGGPHDEPLDADAVIRAILEGTARETGERFFATLVQSLTRVLGVAGAWVTEYDPEARRLRALAFWFEDRFIADYEYAIAGTPCEPVIDKACLVHVPENVVELFPGDPDLPPLGAVGYMGAPLLDGARTVLGHLAILDTKPMPPAVRCEALFRVFAERAAAEVQRLRAEAAVREREVKLSRLVGSAMDAIVELDRDLAITRANPSAGAVFASEPSRMAGGSFQALLTAESWEKLTRLADELAARPEGRQYLWIPGGLRGVRADGAAFPAEASLSRYEAGGASCFTLILRNVHDRLEAERRIESLTSESEYLREEVERLRGVPGILGRSRAVRELLRSIAQVAATDTTVLITGETGTGKELVARAVHGASRRARRALIAVNCAAISPTLMESEFFGHERGAFTGATQRRAGRFALAHEGTIFLDEVGELPLELQAKLLRVLQEGTFEPVGSAETRRVDVRVIAATNRDLREAIRAGRFREDLYYRLAVFPIAVPPLRERREDVPLLAEAFARHHAARLSRRVAPLEPAELVQLQTYAWPGNVRELQNVMERAVITARDGLLNLTGLLPPAAAAPPTSAVPAAEPGEIRTADEMRALERANLVRALERAGWRIAGPGGAARLLGLPASTVASRMRALDIRRPTD
jgi:PAS domain S-box-containing protein